VLDTAPYNIAIICHQDSGHRRPPPLLFQNADTQMLKRPRVLGYIPIFEAGSPNTNGRT
jgi:hypothetical protein